MSDVRTGKSLDEIAAIMASNTIARRDGTFVPNQVGNSAIKKGETNEEGTTRQTDAVYLDTSTGDNTSAQAEDASALVGANNDADADDSADAAAGHGDDLGADDDESGSTEATGSNELETEFTEVEFDDDDLVELAEGVEPVTLGALKKRYQVNETISTKLEEQSTATQEALTERLRAQEDSQKVRQASEMMMKHMTDIITQPLVSLPDAMLKASDPSLYIRHLEAYNQDQLRIKNSQETIMAAIQEHAKQEGALLKNRKAHEFQVLASKVPALRSSDETVRARASQDILDAAGHYGFSPEEINGAVDHRVYQMAHDAQQFRKLMAKSGANVVDLVETAKTKVKQTRSLRSRSTTAKNRLTAKAKQRKVLVAKAKKSGRVDDVAALIAAKHAR